MNVTTKDLPANVSILFPCHFTAIFRGILSLQPAHWGLKQMEVVPPWPGCLLQMWQLGWHGCMALPRVSSGHWLRSSSWSKRQLCSTGRQVNVKYPLIVYLPREAHLRWHQFTLSTEPHAGTWHLVLLYSDPSYSPQKGSSFFISQRFYLWKSYSKLNVFHTVYDS